MAPDEPGSLDEKLQYQEQMARLKAKENIMGEDDLSEDIKLAINNLIWMYGHKDLTLEKAEELAIKILHLLKEKP